MQSNILSLQPAPEKSADLLSRSNLMTPRQTGPEQVQSRRERIANAGGGEVRETERTERTERAVQGERTERSFQDVLQSVTGEERDRSRGEQPQAQTAEIEKKVETLRAKIKEIQSDPELAAKIDTGKLNEFIEKLLTFMKQSTAPASEGGAAMTTENRNDFLKALDGMLNQLDQLLQNPAANAQAIQAFVNQSNTQMSEGFAKAQASSQKVEPKTIQAALETTESESVSETPRQTARVEVRDLRTEQPVAKPKEAMKTAPTFTVAVKKETAPAATAADANRIQPAAQAQTTARETAVIQQQNIQIARHLQDPAVIYTQASGSVSRANLDALMQGITGKALITLRDGNTEFKMRLFPPELGGMNMKFVLEDGVLTAKVIVSTQEAKMLFDQNQHNLQQSLAEAGIQLGSLDVSMAGSDSQGEGQETAPSFTGNAGLTMAEFDDLAPETSPYLLYDSSVNFIA